MVGLPKAIIKKYGVTKKAWAVFRGRKHRRSKRSRRYHPVSRVSRSRSVRNLARRRRYHGRSRGSLYKGVMRLAKTGALLAPGLRYVLDPAYSTVGKARMATMAYTGYDLERREWHPSSMVEGWAPFLGVCLAEKGISFVNKLVRKL